MERGLEKMPNAARIRRQTVGCHALPDEWATDVKMSRHVLAYNLQRAMRIFGVMPLLKMMRA
jgi:hypothetical protein